MAKMKLVGTVTTEEKNEIQQLFERRNGLNELAKILSVDNAELYEKLVKDLGETKTKFQAWWSRMSSNTNGKVSKKEIGKSISIPVKSI